MLPKNPFPKFALRKPSSHLFFFSCGLAFIQLEKNRIYLTFRRAVFSSKMSSCTCVSILGGFIIFSAVLFSSNCSFLVVLTSVFSRRGIKPILLEIPPGIFFHVIARDRVPRRNQSLLSLCHSEYLSGAAVRVWRKKKIVLIAGNLVKYVCWPIALER